MHDRQSEEIVFTGLGIVSRVGVGLGQTIKAMKGDLSPASSEDYRLSKWQPAPYLSDRRMLKAVSAVDAYGLVAIENLKTVSGYQAGQFDPHLVGLYVGAAPASVFDNQNYFKPMLDTRGADGKIDIAKFGKTFANARPTTLLAGLPNNVLCYGAIIMNAKGPNSNYLNLETSSHIAIKQAVQNLKIGRLKYAIAGGYGAHTDPADQGIFRALGYIKNHNRMPHVIEPYSANSDGTIMSEGSVFISLEHRKDAEKRGAHKLATYLALEQAHAAGNFEQANTNDEALVYCMRRCLQTTNITPNHVGMVFGTGYGLHAVDALELSALEKVFGTATPSVALATSSKVLGNLMEAGGVAEVGLANWIYHQEDGVLPEHLAASASFAKVWSKNRPYALILRSNPTGDCTCLLIRV